jgi:hypothetical protein
MRPVAITFVSVSAILLPGRSGMSNVRSSRLRTNPAGSPRGETPSPPSGDTVATHTNGDRSMYSRKMSFNRSAILPATSGDGAPITSRRADSVSITRRTIVAVPEPIKPNGAVEIRLASR